MKTGTLICYTLGPDVAPVQRNRLRKLLLGYTDHSNKGQYKYSRDGLLTSIPVVKLVRSVFIVNEKDAKEVTKLLDQFNAQYHVRKVILTKDDVKVLDLD